MTIIGSFPTTKLIKTSLGISGVNKHFEMQPAFNNFRVLICKLLCYVGAKSQFISVTLLVQYSTFD